MASRSVFMQVRRSACALAAWRHERVEALISSSLDCCWENRCCCWASALSAPIRRVVARISIDPPATRPGWRVLPGIQRARTIVGRRTNDVIIAQPAPEALRSRLRLSRANPLGLVGSAQSMERDHEKAPHGGAPLHGLRVITLAVGVHPVGCLGSSGQPVLSLAGKDPVTPLGRDARGLTSAVVTVARVMQPGIAMDGNRTWHVAQHLRGGALAAPPRRRSTATAPPWRTPALANPWPDSSGGKGRVGSQASPQLQVTPSGSRRTPHGVPVPVQPVPLPAGADGGRGGSVGGGWVRDFLHARTGMLRTAEPGWGHGAERSA
ncbi:hypothetical protein BBFGKLBO_01370 [Synechococcus sp. CBW1107]|nr:hypothetical protein BBFGKLBO_01370 [Synechococcus sp. CBW1107]